MFITEISGRKVLEYYGPSVENLEQAWKITFAKWEWIVGLEEDILLVPIGDFMADTCGLCMYSRNFWAGYPECTGCPIRTHTGPDCFGTPFLDFVRALHYQDWEAANEFAKRELRYLRELHEKLETSRAIPI